MEPTERRTFLKTAGAGALALAVHTSQQAAAADDEKRPLSVALIGAGGMGSYHLRLLSARPDVHVTHVCDVDQQRLAKAAKLVAGNQGKDPQTVQDLRQVLDDQTVDAVFIATPDHWHTPAAVLALQAGKHVYVEKPCCHNLREGRLLIEAAKKAGRVVQVGTQSRSTPTVAAGVQRVLDGEIGEVLAAKAWNSQLRRSIGKTEPSSPPEHLDFDLWLGPAPEQPFRSNLLHSIWRWWHAFGCGDIGNDGVHDLDVALWGLNVDSHPSSIACLGAKTFFDDDQQFPDTQYAVYQYANASAAGKPKQMVFEQRIWSPYTQEGYENGSAWYGTEGVLIMGHTTGWKMYGRRNKLLAEMTGGPDLPAHHTNFFDAIRGKIQQVNAPPQAGHLSAGLVHLANIAARTNRTLQFDPQREQIIGDAEANALLTREYRPEHWAIPRV